MELIKDSHGRTVQSAENYPHIISKCELCGREEKNCIEVDNAQKSNVCMSCAQKITFTILESMFRLENICNDERFAYSDMMDEKRLKELKESNKKYYRSLI